MNSLSRRGFALSVCSAAFLRGFSAYGAIDSATENFDELFAQSTSDEAAIENAKQYKALAYREIGPSPEALAAAPNLPRRYRSQKAVSARAKSLIIRFEVSGQTKYNSSYRKPTWPKGQSGVTIGIGYDLGYTSRALMTEDWSEILPDATIAALAPACKVNGPAANGLLPFLADVDVPWTAATQQFDRFLPYAAGETVHAFPQCEELSSDSFGALVSLVYNRGSAMRSRGADEMDRRKEMRVIKEMIAASSFSEVPSQIRMMKRIWEGDRNARGLLERRELEARLFEVGLS